MIDNFKKTDKNNTDKNNTDNKAQTPENTGKKKLDLDEMENVSGAGACDGSVVVSISVNSGDIVGSSQCSKMF